MNEVYLNWFTHDETFPFFIQYGGHDEDTRMHVHVDFSELVIILSGTATHVVGNEEMFIKKGDVFVINGATPHGYKNTHNFKICNIMYRTNLLPASGNSLNKSSGFQALFVIEPNSRHEQMKSRLNLDLPSLEFVVAHISALVREYEEKQQAYQTMVSAGFLQLIVYLSRQYENQVCDKENNLIHLAKAVSYLEDHYLEQLSMEELAAKSKLSIRHLNRIFKAHYQLTPLEYIHQLRLEHACILLKKTNLPITVLSYESGFNDSNYFTRQFTKKFGMSPTAYRRHHQFSLDRTKQAKSQPN
ncbi:helix-turn-helix domain-containing protein [Gorillibacterium sp. CAU 1737]|uniref:helix-turn-helix domain-containing protein n=1 Tax=Gorillibacterium sp. CAU 1737 TaxID=3140362 RepID=UPI003260619A